MRPSSKPKPTISSISMPSSTLEKGDVRSILAEPLLLSTSRTPLMGCRVCVLNKGWMGGDGVVVRLAVDIRLSQLEPLVHEFENAPNYD